MRENVACARARVLEGSYFYTCMRCIYIYICAYIYMFAFGNLSNSSVFDVFFSDVGSLELTCLLC